MTAYREKLPHKEIGPTKQNMRPGYQKSGLLFNINEVCACEKIYTKNRTVSLDSPKRAANAHFYSGPHHICIPDGAEQSQQGWVNQRVHRVDEFLKNPVDPHIFHGLKKYAGVDSGSCRPLHPPWVYSGPFTEQRV